MQPVDYTGAACAVVQTFNSLNNGSKEGSYWSDPATEQVRKQIKDHYIAEQHQRCCYCRRQIQTNNNAVWDAEHIISRDARPQFMFEPRNLAISCKDCNIAKGEQNVMRNKNRVTFPVNSDDYVIVHPHFDEYETYILWFGPVVVAATSASTKGSTTIKMCNLLRYSQQFGNLKGDVGDQRYRDRIGELMSSRTRQDAETILAELTVLVARLPDSG
ncbi:HNH endonuclease [Methylorubrum populi]|uniref:HNH endonuclease n=1 Tax=Methylorubrum populi TaxID=223967 RepID=UPI001151EE80|nr:HNH endonuclease [Methylorubrum populi]QDI79790.1 HNH endonuclease [Methylorubrum populi]